jgi:hypothetical protein
VRTSHEPFLFDAPLLAYVVQLASRTDGGCSFAHQGQFSVVTRRGPIGPGVRGDRQRRAHGGDGAQAVVNTRARPRTLQ